MDQAELPDAEIVDKTIEDRAVRFVIDQERRFGRDAHDRRRKPGAADVARGDRVVAMWPMTASVVCSASGRRDRTGTTFE